MIAPDGSFSDQVGMAGSSFAEGIGLPIPATYPSGQFGWVRKLSAGAPVDTDNNSRDFSYVAVDSNDSGHGSPALGVPTPSNLSSPQLHNDVLQSWLVDPKALASAYPNRIISGGNLIINRTVVNCSGQVPVPGGPCANAPGGTLGVTFTSLRFRITGLTTINSPGAGAGQAVLEAMKSPATGEVVNLSGGGSATVSVLPLDAPSAARMGGLNATWTATAGLPSGGLKPGDRINVEFEFHIVQGGSFNFAYNTEGR